MCAESTRALHIEVAELRSRLAELERARRPRLGRYRARFLGGVLVAAFLAALVPLSLLAATPFNDLTGGVHDPDIEAIYNAGITTGCVPQQSYCPLRDVTRQEMASFLARTAGIGGNPPVTNAKTLRGYAPDGLVRVAKANTTTTGPDLSATPATLVAVTIQSPGAGFILVDASSVFNGLVGSVTVRAYLRDAGNGDKSQELWAQVGSGADAAQFQSLSPVWVFPVAAGAHTFQLQAYVSFGTGSPIPQPAQAGFSTITALFVPFDGNGAVAP